MATYSISGSTGKQIIISLHGLSHEVCVAATQVSYWQQVNRDAGLIIERKISAVVNQAFKYFHCQSWKTRPNGIGTNL